MKEYKTYHVNPYRATSLEDNLNRLAKLGWEVKAVVPVEVGSAIVLERETPLEVTITGKVLSSAENVKSIIENAVTAAKIRKGAM